VGRLLCLLVRQPRMAQRPMTKDSSQGTGDRRIVCPEEFLSGHHRLDLSAQSVPGGADPTAGEGRPDLGLGGAPM